MFKLKADAPDLLRMAGLSLVALVGGPACSLEGRPHDGLVIQSADTQYEFAQASSSAPQQEDGGEPAGPDGSTNGAGGDAMPKGGCINLALFTQQVTPHLIESCTECHDGSKLKAYLTLDLERATDASPEAQQITCRNLLASVEATDLAQSAIFTEVDPANLETEHDFKYPDQASYQAYFDAVMGWLQTEMITP